MAQRLHVTAFLRNGGTLEQLQEKPYLLSIEEHAKFPNLVCLHYEHTKSDSSNAIVRECRGVVLDADAEWNPVCLPYVKFDNYRINADKIDWETASVFEKVDGTLMNLYFACGEWHVSTSSLPDARGSVMGSIEQSSTATFASLFWEVWREMGYPDVHTLPTNVCYMFELITPQNRVIVPTDTRRLLLHGARNMDDLIEMNAAQLASECGLVALQPLHFEALEAVVEAARLLSPANGEGFIVVHGDWQRVKIKSPAYVLAALLPQNEIAFSKAEASDPLVTAHLSPRQLLTLLAQVTARLARIVALGEGEEFACAFPHLRQPLQFLHHKLALAVEGLEQRYHEVLSITQGCTDKEFSQLVLAMPDNDKKSSSMFVKLRKGIASARELLCAGPDKELTSMWDSMHEFDDFELTPTAPAASSDWSASSLVSSDSEEVPEAEIYQREEGTTVEHPSSANPAPAEHDQNFTMHGCQGSAKSLQSDGSMFPHCANVDRAESAALDSGSCSVECQEQVDSDQGSSWKSSASDFQ